MLDRIRALLEEKAAANAAHDGVPVGIVHLHGAAHEVSLLVMQARDQLIAAHGRPARPAAAHESEPAAAPAPVPAPVAKAPAAEEPPAPIERKSTRADA